MTDIEANFLHVGELRAYLARPAGGSTGAMLLLPMITGIGAQVREYAEDIARAGATALVWDPWHGPSADDTPHDRLAEMMGRLDDEASIAEMGTLLDYAVDELGVSKIGVIGWCLGGRLALLLAARDERPAAVVAYHPSIWDSAPPNHTLDAVDQASTITAPVMVLHAGADTVMSAEIFRDLQQALQQRRTGATIIHVYPGAEHGFSVRSRHGNQVNADAYALSWPQVLRFVADTTLG